MPLSYPVLKLSNVEETVAFRAVDSVLRHDATLKRVLKHYNSWTGDSQDVFPPSPGTCPFLQIAPKPLPGKWESEGEQSLPFAITITCAVNGTNVDQLMNLWGHVRRALWPSDATASTAVHTKMVAARISKGTLGLGGFGVHMPKDGGRVLIAQGSLNILLLIATP
jgi:hypothetical protein